MQPANGVIPLDGFVRVQLDERLGSAAAAAMQSAGAQSRGAVRWLGAANVPNAAAARFGSTGSAGAGAGVRGLPVKSMTASGMGTTAGTGTVCGSVAAVRAAARQQSPEW